MWRALALAGALGACSSGGGARRRPAVADGAVADAVAVAPDRIADAAEPDAASILDLDGDGAADQVEESFSGGAHCCYRLTLALSSGPRLALPFELDGGDVDRAAHFAVADGGRAIDLWIATYAGRAEALTDSDRAAGARSHHVRVRAPAGRIAIENLGWSCALALEALAARRWAAWEGLAAACTLDEVTAALDAVAGVAAAGRLGADGGAVADHAITLAADDGAGVVAVRGGAVVRIDLEVARDPSRALTSALGRPARFGPAAVWVERGVDARRTARGWVIGVFAATDRATYETSLARP